QVGPFVSTRLSEYISMSGQVGYVWGQFTGSETAGNQAGGNPSTFFLNGGVDHRVNQFLNYSLTASRSTQLSATVGQNFVEVWLFNLSPCWKIIDKMTISTPLSVTFGQQSGTLNAETYQTYSASASLGYKLTEKLGSSVNFSYLIKNSDQNSGLQNGSYNQWNAALNFSYDF
ncbi:MAG: hypothetical protein NTZ01_06705, partial [Verrucomicrobia bacterium]|nr:hypothetical protein [Verrucomicrobiota bacterium]